MKKIGFVDYFLNEWHANNYPAWIRAKNAGFEVSYAYGEIASPQDGMTSEQWCEKNGVTYCADIDELCEKSDYIVILSPDNAERHLLYAKAVLKHGKPTYIDKTFAPDVATAKEIFALSEKYNCPICSSSALRFAPELKTLRDVENMVSVGGGLTYDIYAIHQLEMIVCLMGSKATRIMATQSTKSINITIDYPDGRRAGLIQNVYCSACPFMLLTESRNSSTTEYTVIKSDFFQYFIDAMLGFFDTGKKLAEKDETISVISFIEAGKKALQAPDRWIDIVC